MKSRHNKAFFFLAVAVVAFVFQFNAQSNNDSLIKLLSGKLADTARCNVLLEIIANEPDDNVWPKFNTQLLQFAEAKLKTTDQHSPLYFFYKKKLAEAFGNIGYLAQVKGDFNQSLDYYNRSLAVHQAIKNVSGEAICYHNISTIYLTQGNLSLSMKYALKSKEKYEKLRDDSGLAYVFNDLATLSDLKGEIVKSYEYYAQSLKLYEKTNNQIGAAQVMSNLANSFYAQGEIDKSLEYHQKSLRVREKLGDKRGTANSLTGIGGVYFKQGKFAFAMEMYNSSIVLQKEIGDRQGVANNYFHMAEVFLLQGKLNEAKENFFKSFYLNDSIGYKMGVAGSQIKIGGIFLKENNLTKAAEFLTKGMELSKTIGLPENIRDAAELLSEYYQTTKNPLAALANYKLYIKLRDSLNSISSQKASIRLQEQKEFEKQKALSDQQHQMQLDQQKRLSFDQDQKQRLVILLIGFILFLALCFSFFLYKRFKLTNFQKQIIEAKEKETQTQKLLLEEKHKEITDSINYAKNIQAAFMPNEDIFLRLFENSFLFFRPKDVVSGDFYWFYTQAENNVPAPLRHIAVADCTGHGVPGALMSVICSNALNEAVVQKKITATSDIVDEARTVVKRSLKTRKFQERKDGMDLAFVSINFETLELWFTGANNPAWVIQGKNLIELKADKQPVGVFEKESNFTQQYLKLSKGDLVYLFSDGMPDQFGGTKGKKYKYKQLAELLMSVAHLPMNQQKEKIASSFDAWKGNLEQVDDVTVLGIRI